MQRVISMQPGLQAVAAAGAVLRGNCLCKVEISLTVPRLRGCFRGTTPSLLLLLLTALHFPGSHPELHRHCSPNTVPGAPHCSGHRPGVPGPPQLPAFPRTPPAPGPGSAGRTLSTSPAPNPEKQHRLGKEMEEVREKLGESGKLL